VGFSITTLTPTFNSTTYTYDIFIPFEHSEIQVDTGATTTIDPFHEVTFTLPENIPANAITQFIVSAVGGGGPGGAEQTDYTINIHRGAPNENAALSNLVISGASLTPAFGNLTFEYTSDVLHTVTAVTVTATAQDPGSTMEFNADGGSYTLLTSGIPSGSIPLPVGVTQIIIRVTSSDTTVTKAYVIDVTRQPPPPDSDSDGMPDAYEDLNGLTVGVNDAMLDLDGDGLCNICEYAFGSDPDDFSDHNDPVITRNISGFTQISFPRAIDPVEGLSYHVEVTSDPIGWSSDVIDLTNPGTPESQVWKDNFEGSPTPPARRFIRIRFTSTL